MEFKLSLSSRNENNCECTIDQELAEHCCIDADRRFVFTYQKATFFCVKWRHGRHLESVTANRESDSVTRCVFTWIS